MPMASSWCPQPIVQQALEQALEKVEGEDRTRAELQEGARLADVFTNMASSEQETMSRIDRAAPDVPQRSAHDRSRDQARLPAGGTRPDPARRRRRGLPRRQSRLRRAGRQRLRHHRLGHGALPWFPEIVDLARRAAGARPRRPPDAHQRIARLPLAADLDHRQGLRPDRRRRLHVAGRAGAAPACPQRGGRGRDAGRRSRRRSRAGLDVTHLDTHMGAAAAPEFVELYLELGREYRLPVLLPRQSSTYARCSTWARSIRISIAG